MSRAASLVLIGICACGGGKKPEPVAPDHGNDTTATDTHAGSNVAPEPPQPTKPAAFAVENKGEPEFFAPAWKKVAVGQTVAFSTAVIDQDLDETRVTATSLPPGAKFDAITQTITFRPTSEGTAEFELTIDQPSRNTHATEKFSIEVVKGKAQPAPVAPEQSPVIETLLMIRQPRRLEQVNKDWPLDRLLEVGADTFKLQIPEDKRAKLTTKLSGKDAYAQMLAGLAQTHQNPRLDPKSPLFDKAAFGDPKSWKIVAFRPRIDKAWTELRVVYQAMNAPEPVFAMFRLRPVVEYVPATPRPDEEREANNKIFLGMVGKRLLKDGAVNPAFVKDQAAHGKAVSALMTDVMTFSDPSKPYLHGFEIGIALEARMGGGSARDADGSYASGDGWGWNAMKPFQTADGDKQAYVNVNIPGFWTQTVPSKDGKTWVPRCAPRFNAEDADHVPGYEVLCRKTMGFVDLPDMKDGKVTNGKVDANNLYFEHKKKWMTETALPLEDGRRDLGEENGMTCSQCHIRNFGMHDYGDPANVDPSAGTPKHVNHGISTLNFQIIPSTRWEAFTLEFLDHQECRGKMQIAQYLGPEAARGLGCALAVK
jgi:hypothetical protein